MVDARAPSSAHARALAARRRAALTGLAWITVGAAVVWGVLAVRSQDPYPEFVVHYADFENASGLREGAPVLVGGLRRGRVESVNFVQATYTCDPQFEDAGRAAQRMDECAQDQFCAEDAVRRGMCASLEQNSSRDALTPCVHQDACDDDEVCVTRAWKRTHGGAWSGPTNVCARRYTRHARVRVTMRIASDARALLSNHSEASITSAGLLGDKLVAITPGRGDGPLAEGARIRSQPSLMSSLQPLREQAGEVADKIEGGLENFAPSLNALLDPRKLATVQHTIHGADGQMRMARAGQGPLGEWVTNPVDADGQTIPAGQTLSRSLQDIDAKVRAFNGVRGDLEAKAGDIETRVATLRDDIHGATVPMQARLAGLSDPSSTAGAWLVGDGHELDDAVRAVGSLRDRTDAATRPGAALSELGVTHKLWDSVLESLAPARSAFAALRSAARASVRASERRTSR